MVDGTAGNADRLEAGESLVIYTDGLTDAMDPSDTLFGEDRLKTLLQSHHGADPTEILNQVDEALDQAHVARPPGRRYQHHRSAAGRQVIAPQRGQRRVKLVWMVRTLSARRFVRL